MRALKEISILNLRNVIKRKEAGEAVYNTKGKGGVNGVSRSIQNINLFTTKREDRKNKGGCGYKYIRRTGESGIKGRKWAKDLLATVGKEKREKFY